MGSNHRNRKGRPRNAYRKQDSIDTTTKHNQSKLTAGAGISFVLVLPWLSQFESRSHARYFQRQIDLVWALFYLRIFFLVFCLVAVCVLRLFLGHLFWDAIWEQLCESRDIEAPQLYFKRHNGTSLSRSCCCFCIFFTLACSLTVKNIPLSLRSFCAPFLAVFGAYSPNFD